MKTLECICGVGNLKDVPVTMPNDLGVFSCVRVLTSARAVIIASLRALRPVPGVSLLFLMWCKF